jgi:hypothetical protein
VDFSATDCRLFKNSDFDASGSWAQRCDHCPSGAHVLLCFQQPTRVPFVDLAITMTGQVSDVEYGNLVSMAEKWHPVTHNLLDRIIRVINSEERSRDNIQAMVLSLKITVDSMLAWVDEDWGDVKNGVTVTGKASNLFPVTIRVAADLEQKLSAQQARQVPIDSAVVRASTCDVGESSSLDGTPGAATVRVERAA